MKDDGYKELAGLLAGGSKRRREASLRASAGSPPFLLEISDRLRTQDSRCTENPMFCVQTKHRDVVPDGFSSDTIWVLDGEEVDAGTEGAEEYCIRERWETVMVAFTEEGCKEYLRQNGHNLSKPRIYVESFNRCPEMIAIREWLLANTEVTDAGTVAHKSKSTNAPGVRVD